MTTIYTSKSTASNVNVKRQIVKETRTMNRNSRVYLHGNILSKKPAKIGS